MFRNPAVNGRRHSAVTARSRATTRARRRRFGKLRHPRSGRPLSIYASQVVETHLRKTTLKGIVGHWRFSVLIQCASGNLCRSNTTGREFVLPSQDLLPPTWRPLLGPSSFATRSSQMTAAQSEPRGGRLNVPSTTGLTELTPTGEEFRANRQRGTPPPMAAKIATHRMCTNYSRATGHRNRYLKPRFFRRDAPRTLASSGGSGAFNSSCFLRWTSTFLFVSSEAAVSRSRRALMAFSSFVCSSLI